MAASALASGVSSVVVSARGVAVRPIWTAWGFIFRTFDHLPHAERWHSSMMMWEKWSGG